MGDPTSQISKCVEQRSISGQAGGKANLFSAESLNPPPKYIPRFFCKLRCWFSTWSKPWTKFWKNQIYHNYCGGSWKLAAIWLTVTIIVLLLAKSSILLLCCKIQLFFKVSMTILDFSGWSVDPKGQYC